MTDPARRRRDYQDAVSRMAAVVIRREREISQEYHDAIARGVDQDDARATWSADRQEVADDFHAADRRMRRVLEDAGERIHV